MDVILVLLGGLCALGMIAGVLMICALRNFEKTARELERETVASLEAQRIAKLRSK